MWSHLFLYTFISFSEGIYPPNYGHVGCYSKTMRQYVKFMKENGIQKTSFSRHKCIQRCLGNGHKYAGFSDGDSCYCLRDYNQTYAVEQKKCSMDCHGENDTKCGSKDTVTIFNTRYDSKLLIAVPGGQSFLVSLWNNLIKGQFQEPFTDSFYRNPDIDKWKNGNLYHKPEYVSMVASNIFGHNIWSLDFTTKGIDNGDIQQWMRQENILSNENPISITSNGGNIIFRKQDQKELVWFAHLDVLPEGKRVTIATQDSQPHQVYNTSKASVSCSEDGTKWRNITPPFGLLENALLCTIPLNEDKTPSTHCEKFECLKGNSMWEQYEHNFGKHERSRKDIHWNKVLEIRHWIGSFSLESTKEHCEEFSYTISITDEEKNINLQLFDGEQLRSNKRYHPGSFIKPKRIKINTGIEIECFPLHLRYETYNKDNQMMVVDRLAVFGFYHQEEPKRSKWQFLNDYSMEEIMNIMQPHLSKMRKEGAVQKRNLSASTRKKKSADDKRSSSQGLGAIGGCLLAFVFLIIVIADIPVLKQQVTKSFARLNYFYQSIRQKNKTRRGQKQRDD